MRLKWEWTIPNALSLFRIVLIPIFAVLYLKSEQQPALLGWSIVTLVISGLTDMFDGLIARACHQITEIGKVLDPIADKLTQVTVVLCLTIRIPRLWPLFAVCFVKELLQAIGAALLLFRKQSQVQAARWYGKISTIVFYVTMALYVVFPPAPAKPLLGDWNMPIWLFMALGGLVALLMLIAFYGYARVFLKITKDTDDTDKTTLTEGDTTI